MHFDMAFRVPACCLPRQIGTAPVSLMKKFKEFFISFIYLSCCIQLQIFLGVFKIKEFIKKCVTHFVTLNFWRQPEPGTFDQ